MCNYRPQRLPPPSCLQSAPQLATADRHETGRSAAPTPLLGEVHTRDKGLKSRQQSARLDTEQRSEWKTEGPVPLGDLTDTNQSDFMNCSPISGDLLIVTREMDTPEYLIDNNADILKIPSLVRQRHPPTSRRRHLRDRGCRRRSARATGAAAARSNASVLSRAARGGAR